MKTLASSPNKKGLKSQPTDYAELCREVWLPRPLHDQTDYEAALAALEPFWGHEQTMNQDQTDWFSLVASLIGDYEDTVETKPKALSAEQRLAALLAEHKLTAADLARLLELEPSMGSKLLNGTRRLTASHIVILAKRFTMPAEYFLKA